MHFSIDDVLPFLLEAGDSNRPCDHWFLRFLEEIHALTQDEVNLYLFEAASCETGRRTLAELTGPVSDWIRERAWLRFGPHALDTETPPHAQTLPQQVATMERIYQEIDRIAGSDRYSRWVRLHYFSEAWELASLFRERGVEALLTTDKEAVCYRLPDAARSALAQAGTVEYRGLQFIRSDIRVETIAARCCDGLSWDDALQSVTPQFRPPVVFTHEYALADAEIRHATHSILARLLARNEAIGEAIGTNPYAGPAVDLFRGGLKP